jgi:flagellar motor switch protein FliN/FliY
LATIDDVECDISVVLGTTAVAIHQLLRMGRGAIIELDSSEEDEVTVLANNMPVAKGKVTVTGGRIAVAISRLLPRPPILR